jgi:hypothetical protein
MERGGGARLRRRLRHPPKCGCPARAMKPGCHHRIVPTWDCRSPQMAPASRRRVESSIEVAESKGYVLDDGPAMVSTFEVLVTDRHARESALHPPLDRRRWLSPRLAGTNCL